MRVRVKICGITRKEDALLAAQLGADAIGFIFYPDSSRFVNVEQAKKIAHGLPPYVNKVGVFVNATTDQVAAIVHQIKLDYLQFHGDELAQFCDSFAMPYIKAIHMKPDIDLIAKINAYPGASGFLLDTYHRKAYGGTGIAFPWQLVPHGLNQPIIVSGGISADNVREAIQTLHPYAVDVSSKVEHSPGIKDPKKLQMRLDDCKSGNNNDALLQKNVHGNHNLCFLPN